jgi:1-acyl-sn-glycerol-3-phosphate acyltransferase
VKRARVLVCILLLLVQGIVFELWVRLTLLRYLGGCERGRIATLNRVIRLWGISMTWILRTTLSTRLQVVGAAPEQGRFLILSNHQSSVDIPFLMSVFRAHHLKFVSKMELRHWKLAVSVALRNGGFAFVGKEDTGEDLATLVEFGRRLERFDGSPVLFPEGWRTEDGELRAFLFGGVEAVRRECRLPVLPVTIDGLWQARTALDLDRLVGETVTVRIGDEIPWDEANRDPRATYRAVEKTIRRNLEEGRRASG